MIVKGDNSIVKPFEHAVMYAAVIFQPELSPMISRRAALSAAAAAFSLLIAAPSLADVTAFSQAAFDAAMKDGKPVLLQVHADWCPTCRAQAPILGKLTADPRFKDMTVLRVDFDGQKDVLQSFGVRQQSTLIVFKAGKEAGRSVGDTAPESLAALLDKAL